MSQLKDMMNKYFESGRDSFDEDLKKVYTQAQALLINTTMERPPFKIDIQK